MSGKINIIKEAKSVLAIEAESISSQIDKIDAQFVQIVELIHESRGRLVISGIGKSAIIAQKIVATLNSTGTASIFMHAADAIHGDLGIIQNEDIVLLISNSGNTSEIQALIPLVKMAGNTLMAMTGNSDSVLNKEADFSLLYQIEKEACPLNLAPTSSTTIQLALGDALAVCLLKVKGFTSNDFAKYHPGGALGKKLYLTLGELAIQNEVPQVKESDGIDQVLMEISSKRLGATVVVNEGSVIGVITDGDIRRMLSNKKDWNVLTAGDIMTKNPSTMKADQLAIKGREVLSQKNISQLIIVDQNENYLGMVHFHDLIKEGIVSI